MSLLNLSAGPGWTVDVKRPRFQSVDSSEDDCPEAARTDAESDGEHFARGTPTPDPTEEPMSPLVTLSETHNVFGKAWLCKHFDAIVALHPTLGPWLEYMSLKETFDVEYTTRGKVGSGLGRYYPSRGESRTVNNELRLVGNSLHGMPRVLASIVAPPGSVELDLANANPRILLGICDHLGVACPNLRLYVDNREDCLRPYDPVNFLGVLKPLALSEDGHRARSKDAPIHLLFGGAVEGLSNFGYKLRSEFAEIRQCLVEALPALYDTICYAKASIRVQSTFLYYLISTLETAVMKRLIVLCNNQSIVVNSWCADGIDVIQTPSTTTIDGLQEDLRMPLDLPRRFAWLTQNKLNGISLPIVLQLKKNDVPPSMLSLGYSDEAARVAYTELKWGRKGAQRKKRAILPKEKSRELAEAACDGVAQAYLEISRPSLDLARRLKYDVREISERYLPRDIFQSGMDHIVRSPMGSGKTTVLQDTLPGLYNNNRQLKVLFITPRESLARWSQSEFEAALPGLTSYKDVESIKTASRIVVQCESLHLLYGRIRSEQLHFDVLVLDEIESIWAQMVSGDTHGRNMSANVIVFEDVLRRATQIIALDGMLSNLTLETISDLRPTTVKRLLINNSVKTGEQRNMAVWYKKDNEKRFCKSLMDAIKQKKKLVLVFYSVKKCEWYRELIKTVLKDDEIWILNGLTTNRRKDLSNLTETWRDAKVRVVMYTSSITVGVSYDPPVGFRFDEQFFIAGSGGACARDMCQSLLRARHLKNRLCHVLMSDNQPLNAPPTLKDIEEQIARDIETITIPQYGAFEKAPSWLARIYRWRKHEQSMSSSHFSDVMTRYMFDAGYDFVEHQDTAEKGSKTDAKFQAPLFKDIPAISFAHCEELKKRKKGDGISIDESFQIEKYYFAVNFKSTPDAVEFAESCWDNGGWNKHNEIHGVIASLRAEKTKLQDYSLACDDKISSYDIFFKSSLLRRTLFFDLTRRLGIQTLYSSPAGTKHTISSEDIESTLAWVQDNENSIRRAFACRSKARDILKFSRSCISDILKRYGISCASEEARIASNGKRRREYAISLIVGPIYEHLQDTEFFDHTVTI